MDNSKAVPFKRMRYPVENGELFQNRLRERREQIMDFLDCPYDTAEEISKRDVHASIGKESAPPQII